MRTALPTLRVGVALAAALALAPTTSADVLCLKDGRIFDGVNIRREPGTIVIEFEHGEVSLPNDKVLEIITEGDGGFVPKTDEEKKMVEKGLVRYQGKWMSPKKRGALVQKLIDGERERVEEMKANRLWRNRLKEDSKNFSFEVTVPQHIFENYRDLCEAYFSEFVKAWKIRPPRDLGKLKLKFYVDRDDFLQVTGSPPGVLGFFRFVEPYELNIYYDRLDPLGTEEVMYHEVGHYLQKLVDIEFKYPHWPGESISEYYAASVWDPVKKKLAWGGIHEGRVTQIKIDIDQGREVKLKEMILGCQDRNFEDYTWGWSFVHYLLSNKKYASNFRKFTLAIARDRKIDRSPQQFGRHRLKSVTGPDMLDAFMKFMKLKGEDELLEMEKEWRAYIDEELIVSSSRGLANAASRAARLGRQQRAKRLYAEAIETGEAQSLTYHRYASLLDDLGEEEAAHEHWSKAVEMDPLVPEYYIEWGRSLLYTKKGREEGERLLRLAQNIEPDNFYLERNLESLLKQAKRRGQSGKKKKKEAEEEEEASGE